MSTLTDVQIAKLAAAAGFTGNYIIAATAIALAESSGRTDVTSRNPDGGTNVGLWQIDTTHGYTIAQLMDPQTNANAAYKIFKAAGSTWRDWATASNGAADKYLPQILGDFGITSGISQALPGALQNAFSGVGTGIGSAVNTTVGAGAAGAASLLDPVASALAPLASLGDAITWLSSAHNWLRILYIAGGAAVAIVGLVLLAGKQSGVAKAVISVVGPGKITKAAKAVGGATA